MKFNTFVKSILKLTPPGLLQTCLNFMVFWLYPCGTNDSEVLIRELIDLARKQMMNRK